LDSSKTPTEQATVVETQTQPNPIIAAWLAGTPEQRKEFIDWVYDDAPARATPDDGLTIPDYLKRSAP
jgi:hypothetical protein